MVARLRDWLALTAAEDVSLVAGPVGARLEIRRRLMRVQGLLEKSAV